MLKWFGELWCKRTHGEPMWPVNGHYFCSTCLREYPVHWEKDQKALPAPPADKGALHASTYWTRSRSSAAPNGFGKVHIGKLTFRHRLGASTSEKCYVIFEVDTKNEMTEAV